MLVVTRFTVPVEEDVAFADQAGAALEALAGSAGYLRGSLGRAVDDPTRWVLVTEWSGVGAYRRALSRYEVKLAATPLLARAHAEPGAFELVREVSAGGSATGYASDRAADADRAGPGGRTADR